MTSFLLSLVLLVLTGTFPLELWIFFEMRGGAQHQGEHWEKLVW